MDKERAKMALEELSYYLDRCPRHTRYEGLQKVLSGTIKALDAGAKREEIREVLMRYLNSDPVSRGCYH